MEAPYEIWLWLAKRFLRRRCLKSVDDGRRRRRKDNRACLYYKLTYEPKGSGELKMSVINACFACYFLKSICETLLSTSHSFCSTFFVLWLLFTSKNTIKLLSLKLQSRCYVFMGFNRTHLIMLTISVITAGQLNVNSWLSMLLCFISIEYDFVAKQPWI